MTTKKNKKADFDFTTITSFEDACKKEGIDPTKLPEVSMLPSNMQKALVSVYKLFIIFQAINNGWKPNWNDSNEEKYFPWFWVKASAALSSGFGFDDSGYSYTVTDSAVGSRLCTFSKETALYIAKQFQEEYKDFLLFSE